MSIGLYCWLAHAVLPHRDVRGVKEVMSMTFGIMDMISGGVKATFAISKAPSSDRHNPHSSTLVSFPSANYPSISEELAVMTMHTTSSSAIIRASLANQPETLACSRSGWHMAVVFLAVSACSSLAQTHSADSASAASSWHTDNDERDVSQIIQRSIRMQNGDAEALQKAVDAPVRWKSHAGVLELSRSMIIRPITRNDLLARGMKENDAQVQNTRARARLSPLEKDFVEVHNHIIISLPQGVDENQMSAFLMATGDYQYAEPNWMCYPVAVPNDVFYGSQYAHNRTNSEPAWDITTGSTSVIVAITDTGIVLDHQDLQPNLVPGANSASGSVVSQSSGGQVNDLNGHGTHCAGIAGARGNNGLGIAGNAWSNRIMPVRVSNLANGNATLAALQAGATWAAENGARVVSTSYSGAANASNQTVGFNIRTMYQTLWFWAAGNDNSDIGGDAYPDLVITSSTDSLDMKSGFSNFGQAVDIAAPGSGIRATYVPNADSYAYLSGTSMACPNAAGAAGLIFAVNPSLSALTVREILLNQVDDLGAPGEDDVFGRGRVNMGKAVADAYRISFPVTSLPFTDDFEFGAFANNRWVYRDTGVTVSANAVNEPSGTRSANVNASRRLESNAISLNGTVVSLPSGVWSVQTEANATTLGQQGGYEFDGVTQRACLWPSAANPLTYLNPEGTAASRVHGMSAVSQVGEASVGGRPRASLWLGNRESWVNLNPPSATASVALGATATHQIGYAEVAGSDRASLWSGSAESWIDLNPAGASRSVATAGSGGLQGGYALVGGTYRASLWSGSAASWVDLHPPGAQDSRVFALSGSQAVGGVDGRATLWNGSAADRVDLHPGSATESIAYATCGSHQVGYAIIDGVLRAAIWQGTAASFEDLSVDLPGSWGASYSNLGPAWGNTFATGVASDGTTLRISGFGQNLRTGRREALLWLRPVRSDRTLFFSTQARGPGANESLAVEYLNSTNQWVSLQTVTSTGAFESTFTPRSVAIPTGATVRHPKFAVRFRAVGNSTSDNWYIDDVRIGLPQDACDSVDFNNNGVFPEDQDVVDFIDVLAGGQPVTCDPALGCNDIDFNNNDIFPEDQDMVDFFNVLAGGSCP